MQGEKEIRKLATNHHLLEQSPVGQNLPLGLGILNNSLWEHGCRELDLHTSISVKGNGACSVFTQYWASLKFYFFIPQCSQVLLRNHSKNVILLQYLKQQHGD